MVVSVSRIVRNVNDDAAQSVTARVTPGFLSVTFTPHGGLIPPVTVDALLFYCDRLYHAPDCPRWTIGDWCPFCAAFHHSYPGCWCWDGGHDCSKDNAAYNADGALGFRNNRWRGFDGDLTLLDYRFVLPAPCCVCEEHLSSWYSGTPEWRLEEASGNIDAVYIDGNGDVQPLPLGTMTEALHIKGKSPSSAPNDSRVIVKATVQPVGGDEISATFTTLVTVASTRVLRDVTGDIGENVEARLALPDGTERIWANRIFHPFSLLSDVEIDSHLILSLGGTFRARIYTGSSTNSTLLIDHDPSTHPGGVTITNGISVVNGQTVNFATHGERSEVWVQCLSPGTGAITYGFEGKGNAEGIRFTDTLPITAYREELQIQLMAENIQAYIDSVGTGLAVNTDVNWSQLNFGNIMQHVAVLYSNDTRGAGIEMTWAITPLDKPDPQPYMYLSDNTVVEDIYRYTGTIEYTNYLANGINPVITGGKMWINADYKMIRDGREIHSSYFERAQGKIPKLIEGNRDDDDYKEYIKVALPSRVGYRDRDGRYVINASGHAGARCEGDRVFQGAHIEVVSIAEELYLKTGEHYDHETFIHVLEYCIAHEIFHLIGGTHGEEPAIDPDVEAPIMKSFRPLDKIRISEEELLQIDLPNRASILR
ncbi:MAG: hypothetical protein FWH21_05120 [Kiritimatiellaeota bacterium]|nr:hypothetical protein [Kiritimatiellota bacterium]